MSNSISDFSGDFRWLSNFYIEPDGTTVEHEYQAAKTNLLTEKVMILRATTPGRAKRIGQKVAIRDDWEQVKIGEMRSLVLRKFWDHRELATKLLDTEGIALIEGNTWHDNTWGDCLCLKCEEIEGQNLLGIALMDVRSLIRALNP